MGRHIITAHTIFIIKFASKRKEATYGLSIYTLGVPPIIELGAGVSRLFYWSQVCCLNENCLPELKDILSEIYGAAKFGYNVASQVEIERRSWDHVLTQAAQ